jgi:hypothetical protein
MPQAWAPSRHYPQLMARYHSVSVLGFPWPMRLRLIGHGLLFNLGPKFLFQAGSDDVSLHPPGFGQLLVAQSAMLFLAVCSLFDPGFRRAAVFLLGWFAVAAITAVLILPFGHPLHTLMMLTPLTLLCALGMVFLFDLASASRTARLAVAAVILLAAAVQGARFLTFYFRDYPALAAYQFQYGLGDAVVHANSLGSGPVVITQYSNQPYIYVLFYTGYPPERFQQDRVEQAPGLFGPVFSFDRYRFEDAELAYRKLPPGVFVLSEYEPPPKPPVFTVRAPNGHIAFQIVVK